MQLLYPPVDAARFRPPLDAAERAALRRRFDLPDDRAVFLLASTSHRRKGLGRLAAFFANTDLPATLVVAGRPLGGSPANVRWLGYCRDIENLYRAVDFTIVASTYEPFGLVGVESVLCATPVLLGPGVGCGEVIDADARIDFAARRRPGRRRPLGRRAMAHRRPSPRRARAPPRLRPERRRARRRAAGTGRPVAGGARRTSTRRRPARDPVACLTCSPAPVADRHLDLGCGDAPRNPYGRAGLVRRRHPRHRHSGGRFEFRAANLAFEPIPFAADAFASVSAFDFIEHVPRVLNGPSANTTVFPFVRLMDEVWRVLAPGGLFYA